MAAREAAKIYADAVAREPAQKRRIKTAGLDLEIVIGAWLKSLGATLAARTCKTWGIYAKTHWFEHFSSLHDFTNQGAAEYMRARLLQVKSATVRKELSALRHFVRWCEDSGFLPVAPLIPNVPRKALGVAFGKRRRSAPISISREEVLAIIAKLPKWSNTRKLPKQFPIRARFLIGYETGLRPTTLDALEWGIHYRKGSSTILLTDALDKNRWGRELPISEEARAALDEVATDLDGNPAEGLIFGVHEYRPHIRAAAEEVLPKERAERFSGAHFRSAMITHRLEQTGNLPGVQYLAGHRLTSTTARYVRPSLRAALDVVKQGDSANTREKGAKIKASKQAGAAGSSRGKSKG